VAISVTFLDFAGFPRLVPLAVSMLQFSKCDCKMKVSLMALSEHILQSNARSHIPCRNRREDDL
jgi:hypothetical protein